MGMKLTDKLARKKARQEAKAEADRLVLEANYDLCRKMDLLWLYVLHEVCGFGKVRLLRVYWKMIEVYIQVMRKFRYGNDDSHWYAMEKHLREYVGVDVRALQDEADRRYPDGADGAREEG